MSFFGVRAALSEYRKDKYQSLEEAETAYVSFVQDSHEIQQYESTFLVSEQSRLVLLDLLDLFGCLDAEEIIQSSMSPEFYLGQKSVIDHILKRLSLDVTDLLRMSNAKDFIVNGVNNYDDDE